MVLPTEVRDMALKSLYYRFAVEVKVDVQHLRLGLVKRVGTAQVIVESSCCCAGCNMPPNIEETETVGGNSSKIWVVKLVRIWMVWYGVWTSEPTPACARARLLVGVTSYRRSTFGTRARLRVRKSNRIKL